MSREVPDLPPDTALVAEVDEDRAPPGRSRAARWALAVIAGLIVVALVVSVFPRGPNPRPPEPPDQMTGVVTFLSADGSSFCMTLDTTGTRFCSDLLRLSDAVSLVVGQHITGTEIVVTQGSAPGPVFVVTGPADSP